MLGHDRGMPAKMRMFSGFKPGEALCQDCGADLDPIGTDGIASAEYFYMVTDELWRSVKMHAHGRSLLCVGCLEARLGRELVGDDFAPGVSANWPQPQDTARLADRKSRIVRPREASFMDDYQREMAAKAARGEVPAPPRIVVSGAPSAAGRPGAGAAPHPMAMVRAVPKRRTRQRTRRGQR